MSPPDPNELEFVAALFPCTTPKGFGLALDVTLVPNVPEPVVVPNGRELVVVLAGLTCCGNEESDSKDSEVVGDTLRLLGLGLAVVPNGLLVVVVPNGLVVVVVVVPNRLVVLPNGLLVAVPNGLLVVVVPNGLLVVVPNVREFVVVVPNVVPGLGRR